MGWYDIGARIIALDNTGKVVGQKAQIWGGPLGIERGMRDDLLTTLGYDQSSIPHGYVMKLLTGVSTPDTDDVLLRGGEVILSPRDHFKEGDLVEATVWLCQYKGVIIKITGLTISLKVTEVSESVTRSYGVKVGQEKTEDVSFVRKTN